MYIVNTFDYSCTLKMNGSIYVTVRGNVKSMCQKVATYKCCDIEAYLIFILIGTGKYSLEAIFLI